MIEKPSPNIEVIYEEGDDGWVGLSWHEQLQGWVLHFVVDPKLWSPQNFKRWKKIEKLCREILRSRGITKCYGFSKTAKEAKYNTLYGARSTGKLVKQGDHYEMLLEGEI